MILDEDPIITQSDSAPQNDSGEQPVLLPALSNEEAARPVQDIQSMAEMLPAVYELPKQTWTISAEINKSKRVKSIPLNDTAITLLESLPSAKDRKGPVFVNPRTGKKLSQINTGWYQVRKAAGLPKLRLHGLRHVFASMLVRNGVPIQAVSRLLCHQSIQLTASRYAHLDMSTLQDAASVANEQLQKAMPKLLPLIPADVAA